MSLSSRLELTQEKILNLYELDSNDLADQIKYWELTRTENMLLYYARKQGIKTLAHQHVPSLASTESKAREAIEMTLILNSLAKSAYAREAWTMPMCSRERLLAPPAYCMKRGGGPIQVQFDNDPSNTVEHTAWDYIYYQDEDDVWHKVPGDVDLNGLYYIQTDNLKLYYVDFKEEAAKYSKTGKWSLLYNNLVTSVDSSPDSGHGPLYTSSPREARAATPDTPSSNGQRHRERYRRLSTPSTPSPTHSPPRPRQRSQSRARGAQIRAVSPSRERGSGRRRRRSTSVSGTRVTSGRGGSGRRSRSRSRRREPPRSGQLTAPTPEEVDSSRKIPTGRSSGRLETLLREARDPPGIILKGAPNNLKCFRYSMKSRNQKLFSLVSTTFHWTESQSTKRVGEARMLVTFTDKHQREEFLKRVTLPKSLSYFTVDLGDI